MNHSLHRVIEDIKNQFGIDPSHQPDALPLPIHTTWLSGTAVQYTSAIGLDVLLVQYRTHASFSLTLPAYGPQRPFLLVSMHTPSEFEEPILTISSSAFNLKLAPKSVGTLILIDIDMSWLQSNLPNWATIADNNPVEKIQAAIAHDPLLVHLLKTEARQFWQLYPARALQSIFVWKSVYNLVYILMERSFHKPTSQSLLPHSSTDYHQIERVCQYIRDNISQAELSIPRLAHMANMSVSKFSRLFKEVYDVSVSKFINAYRLEVAHDLLMTRKYSLGQIAGKVGFRTASGLTKLFLKKYGIAPKYFLEYVA